VFLCALRGSDFCLPVFFASRFARCRLNPYRISPVILPDLERATLNSCRPERSWRARDSAVEGSRRSFICPCRRREFSRPMCPHLSTFPDLLSMQVAGSYFPDLSCSALIRGKSWFFRSPDHPILFPLRVPLGFPITRSPDHPIFVSPPCSLSVPSVVPIFILQVSGHGFSRAIKTQKEILPCRPQGPARSNAKRA
jgi:hypothetical protein